MRSALRSLVFTVATVASAGAAQAQAQPQGGSPLSLREQPSEARLAARPVNEASFRPLATFDDTLLLSGELASDERAIFLTQAEALRATAFRVNYLNAVSNLPDTSRLIVRINDQTIGEIRLDANAAEATAVLPIPVGVVTPGYNSVRLVASQRHRVDCSVKATYELWSSVSLSRSGFIGLPAAAALRRAAELPALAASGAERTPIRIRLANSTDTLTLDRAMRAANALVLAAGIRRPMIEVAEGAGEGPGIDLIVDQQAPAGSVALDGDLGLLYLQDPAQGRTILTLRPGADGERTVKKLVELATATPPAGSEPGRRALANTAGRQVQDGSSLSFSELGFESRVFDGSFLQSSVRFNMPSDFFAAPYGAARLTLDSSFLGEPAPGKRVNIRINDQIAAVVPMNQASSRQIEQQRVDLPIQMFKAGANTVSVEADMAGSTGACDATATRTSASRLVIAGSSQISFGSLARITVLPSLSATLAHGYPYLAQDEATTVAVSSAHPAYLNAAMTWVGRMTASGRAPLATSFRFGPLDDLDASGLFFGPPVEASQTLARRVVSADVRGAGSATPFGTAGSAGTAETSLSERLRGTAGFGALGSVSRGDLGPVADWLEDFGLIERSERRPVSSELLAPDGLTILQEVGSAPGQGWRGFIERQPLPRIKTMVLAADADRLEDLVAKATATHAWSRFNGEGALLRATSWGPENRVAAERHYLPTSHPTPANLRLSVAGWLSLNQGYYLGGLAMLSLLLALTTAAVLKGRRL